MDKIIAQLLAADEPALRYKIRAHVLNEDAHAKKLRALRAQIAQSPRAIALLSERNARGEIARQPYSKWSGAHWVLTMLAELEYPPGDKTLIPLRDQMLTWLFSKQYETELIRRVKGQTEIRIHASIDGNALWYMHKLDIADARAERLATRLLETQWADGGWNCDVRARGDTSSFTESLIPLRALALHARVTGEQKIYDSVARAAEFFLKRNLFKRVRNGRVIHRYFVRLRFPNYWHYDILFALKVMTEAGLIDDARCNDALDVLESKQLPQGGWAAEGKYYRVTPQKIPYGRSLADWGVVSAKQRNDFVTADALHVLRAAGRYTP
ncbi:MAG: hypothetical protein HY741_28365 [Chloroflexi bacterium]|nr:hypothetical protein [Chloroflexota bacterium]